MSQGTSQQMHKVATPRKGHKVQWSHDTLSKDVEMNYRAFCDLWTKQKGLKTGPPTTSVFYKAKREIKAQRTPTHTSNARPSRPVLHTPATEVAAQRAEVVETPPDTVEEPVPVEAAPIVEPIPELPKDRRPRGSRPVAQTFTGRPDRRFKENKSETNGEAEAAEEGQAHNVKKYYEDLELRLDDLLATVDRLRHRQLAETIRHARRLASREVLK